jgi:hypothetical protein
MVVASVLNVAAVAAVYVHNARAQTTAPALYALATRCGRCSILHNAAAAFVRA